MMHRKKVPRTSATYASDVIEDVRHCLWGLCPFQTVSFHALERHAVEKHNAPPAIPRLPREEREIRDIRRASRWAVGLPEVLEEESPLGDKE
jgi:hypothetical protein